MKHILVVELDDTQNGSVYEQFVKGLPPGEELAFDFGLSGNPIERTFDKKSSRSWSPPNLAEYNWLFLRQQQNWANDMLQARGFVFLNDVLDTLGLSRMPIGQLVGWIYGKDTSGDNFVDFGCWGQQHEEESPEDQGQDWSIALKFNVDGVILNCLKEAS